MLVPTGNAPSPSEQDLPEIPGLSGSSMRLQMPRQVMCCRPSDL